MVPTHNGYIFVIDTDSYSGNFERQMCAYITGATGDCGVGSEEAKIFQKENQSEFYNFDEYTELEPDEHGNYRPCSIWITPGYWNDGLGNCHLNSEKGSPKAKRLFNKTAKKLHGKGYRMLDAPAYQSVAIFWNSYDYGRPEDKELQFMMDRAKKFPEYWKTFGRFKTEKIKVLGFRLIKQKTTVEETTVWATSAKE